MEQTGQELQEEVTQDSQEINTSISDSVADQIDGVELPRLRGRKKGVTYKPYGEDVMNYILDARAKNHTFLKITEDLRAQGHHTINPVTVRNLLTRAQAKTLLVAKNNGEKLPDNLKKQIRALYSQSVSLMQDYVNALQELNQKMITIAARNDQEIIKAKKEIIRTIPIGVQLIKEVREQMKADEDREREITIEQKEMYMSTQDIIDKLPEIFSKLKNEGWTIIPPQQVTSANDL